MRNKLIVFVVVLVSCLIMHNCLVVDNFPKINRSGVYELKPTNYKVSVEVKNGLMNANLIKSDGSIVLRSHDASTVHNWALYWDEEFRVLWMTSSDVGGFAWDVSDVNNPVNMDMSDEYVNCITPQEVIDEMPSSLVKLKKPGGQRSEKLLEKRK